MKFKFFVTIVILASMMTPAYAGLIYDESVSGDLGHGVGFRPTLALSAGTNTILGTGSWTLRGAIDEDDWYLSIASGLELIGMTFDWQLISPVSTDLGGFGVQVLLKQQFTPGDVIAHERIFRDASNGNLIGTQQDVVAAWPYSGGNLIGTTGQNGGGGQICLTSCVWSYAINFEVHASTSGPDGQVPEPSTLAIFALGMIGLASRRFKKQS